MGFVGTCFRESTIGQQINHTKSSCRTVYLDPADCVAFYRIDSLESREIQVQKDNFIPSSLEYTFPIAPTNTMNAPCRVPQCIFAKAETNWTKRCSFGRKGNVECDRADPPNEVPMYYNMSFKTVIVATDVQNIRIKKESKRAIASDAASYSACC